MGGTYMWTDLGLLVLRLGVGGMLACSHGWGKLMKFSIIAPHFPDPLGLGSTPSLALMVFAEFFCAIAVGLGFLTRAAAIPIVFGMCIAAFVVHMDDPWSKKEFALLYVIPFLTLMFTGGGKYSLDGLMGKKRVF